MTSSTSSWASSGWSSTQLNERPFCSPIDGPVLLLEGARRDALLSFALTDRLVGMRIADRGAAEHLAPCVTQTAKHLGIRMGQLRGVVVGVGPGSFTGLRIVVSFAKGLACALSIPVIGAPSLDTMLLDGDDAEAIALMEAYSKQVYACGPGLPADVYDPAVVRHARGARKFVIDGPVPSLASDLGNVIDLRASGDNTLLGLATVGLTRLSAGEDHGWRQLVPNYGRPSSAELKQNLAG